MFCFKCGASMPEDATVCPQCATPVQAAPTPPPPPQQPNTPSPAATSAWLNAPGAPAQHPGQYPPQSQPYQQYQPPKTDGGAIASMVLGIASFVLCLSFLAGIPAIILGHISRSKIRKNMGRLQGDGMALTGLILGYISLLFIPIIAAIAIPNLLRARVSANEAAAAATVRSINTAQITYSTQYPDHGYAPDLATLGPGPSGSCSTGTAQSGCLLNNIVGASRCTAGQWCAKTGYKFTVSAVCDSAGVCSNYVVTATPQVSGSTGRKSFCSTSDSVVRTSDRGTLDAPATADECAEWPPFS
jgi:type IV pilus assembly protein PilA